MFANLWVSLCMLLPPSIPITRSWDTVLTGEPIIAEVSLLCTVFHFCVLFSLAWITDLFSLDRVVSLRKHEPMHALDKGLVDILERGLAIGAAIKRLG